MKNYIETFLILGGLLTAWIGHSQNLGEFEGPLRTNGTIGINMEPNAGIGLSIKQLSTERSIFLEGSDGTTDLSIRIDNHNGNHFIFDDVDDAHNFIIQTDNGMKMKTGGDNSRIHITQEGTIGINGNAVTSANLNINGTLIYGIRSVAFGIESDKYGVYGESVNSSASNSYYGVYGKAPSNINHDSWAGYFNGDLAYTGSISDVSDARFKKDIEDLDNGVLDQVMKLRPKKYYMNNEIAPDLNIGNRKEMGFISQDIQQLFPNLVTKSKQRVETDSGNESSEILLLDYMQFIPILTKAIQEQQEFIIELSAEMDKLKGRLASMKKSN